MTFTLQDALRKEVRLERKLNKIQGLLDERSSVKRLRRFYKLTNRLEENQKELDFLETQRDEVSYKLFKNDVITGVEVTVTDSIYDETFVGGQDTQLHLSGKKPFRGFGTRVSLIPNTFQNNTDTFTFGSNTMNDRLDGSYDVTINLLQDGNYIFTETFI
ncbi:MAG: hypothetical protein CL855_04645 [Cryomorphaceae bacterium]|nr:hypothetical protein [Cryomorphaceae bacterium]|tara:strand:+ start:2400 stop:2879 length:480 start_codon:yes stop_codon:yes gene_type:complete